MSKCVELLLTVYYLMKVKYYNYKHLCVKLMYYIKLLNTQKWTLNLSNIFINLLLGIRYLCKRVIVFLTLNTQYTKTINQNYY